jgi:hypothetical protein
MKNIPKRFARGLLRNTITWRINKLVCVGSANLQREPGKNVVVSGVITENQSVSTTLPNASAEVTSKYNVETSRVTGYSIYR